MEARKASKPHQPETRRRSMKLNALWFYVALTVLTVFAGLKPFYNWDCLPYMGAVLMLDEEIKPVALHQKVYGEAKKHIPAEAFSLLTQKEGYRTEMHQNAEGFYQQLPFYYIKPLYVGMAWICYQLGCSLPFSTVLPALLAFWGIGFLLFNWLKTVFQNHQAAIITLLLLVMLPFSGLGRESSPDGLSCFFMLLGAYWFTSKKCWLWVAPALGCAVLTRPDNIIFVGLFALVLFWKRFWSYQDIICTFLVGAIAYIIPKHYIVGYSWETLFHHSFISHLTYPKTQLIELSIWDYINIVLRQSFKALSASLIPLLTILTMLFWWGKNKLQQLDLILWVTIIGTIAVRYLLFPVLWGRFMAPYYLVAILFVLIQFKLLYRPINEAT